MKSTRQDRREEHSEAGNSVADSELKTQFVIWNSPYRSTSAVTSRQYQKVEKEVISTGHKFFPKTEKLLKAKKTRARGTA